MTDIFFKFSAGVFFLSAMKGQAKRFVSQTGKAYKMGAKKKGSDDNIGFLDLVSEFFKLNNVCDMRSESSSEGETGFKKYADRFCVPK